MNSKNAILFLLILIGSTIYGNNKTTNSSNSQFVANTKNQRLDSIIVKYSNIDFQKFIYHYNENNLNTSIECYKRGESEATIYAFEPYYKIEGLCDYAGKVSKISETALDNGKTFWTRDNRQYEFFYNEIGKIDKISSLEVPSQNEYSSFSSKYLYEFGYDSKGNQTSVTIPACSGCKIRETAYNDKNNKIQEVYYTGDDVDKTIPARKIEYAYDQEGKILKYDLYSNYTTEENEEWKLDKSETNEYLFDNYDNILQDQNCFINFDGDNWIKSVRHFKTNSGKSFPVLPNFIFNNYIIDEDFSFENGLINLADNGLLSEEEISYWNNNKKEWEESMTIYYFYSETKTSVDVETTLNSIIKVFPNPTSNYITIDLGNNQPRKNLRLDISNSNGQLVYTGSIIEQSLTINLSNFGKRGLYFINILNLQNNISESRKLILKD